MTKTEGMMDRLMTILTEGAMRSAAAIMRERPAGMRADVERIERNADKCGAICDALRAECLARLDALIAEWRESVEANVCEPVLRAMLNAQANEIAIAALRRAGN